MLNNMSLVCYGKCLHSKCIIPDKYHNNILWVSISNMHVCAIKKTDYLIRVDETTTYNTDKIDYGVPKCWGGNNFGESDIPASASN